MPDRRAVLALAALAFLPAYRMESNMPTKPTIARIWRGRTRRDVADTYEHYVRAEGTQRTGRSILHRRRPHRRTFRKRSRALLPSVVPMSAMGGKATLGAEARHTQSKPRPIAIIHMPNGISAKFKIMFRRKRRGSSSLVSHFMLDLPR